MNYFFPSILTDFNFSEEKLPDSFLTVNSGENAIRLLLRSYGLKPKAKVALPVYVCDSLKQAVLKEDFLPLYLDLKPGVFLTDYNTKLLLKEKPDVVILVHLYGFLHPDTNAVMEFCKGNNIFLIHDAAQSFGVDEKQLRFSSGLVYSFGPGKSSTAAGGAIVKGLSDKFYIQNCSPISIFSFQKFRAELFLKSRIYGYKFSLIDILLQKIIYRFNTNNNITSMTKFQRTAAATVLQLVNEKSEDRRKRYKLIEEAVNANDLLSIPYNDGKGLYFKMVLSAEKNVIHFKEYLKNNNVPFFSLKEELFVDRGEHDKFPEFCKHARNYIELSTEASLPLVEINRVANVLAKYSL